MAFIYKFDFSGDSSACVFVEEEEREWHSFDFVRAHLFARRSD